MILIVLTNVIIVANGTTIIATSTLKVLAVVVINTWITNIAVLILKVSTCNGCSRLAVLAIVASAILAIKTDSIINAGSAIVATIVFSVGADAIIDTSITIGTFDALKVLAASIVLAWSTVIATTVLVELANTIVCARIAIGTVLRFGVLTEIVGGRVVDANNAVATVAVLCQIADNITVAVALGLTIGTNVILRVLANAVCLTGLTITSSLFEEETFTNLAKIVIVTSIRVAITGTFKVFTNIAKAVAIATSAIGAVAIFIV